QVGVHGIVGGGDQLADGGGLADDLAPRIAGRRRGIGGRRSAAHGISLACPRRHRGPHLSRSPPCPRPPPPPRLPGRSPGRAGGSSRSPTRPLPPRPPSPHRRSPPSGGGPRSPVPGSPGR